MTNARSTTGKRLRDSRSMCNELAKSGISLPLLFTPQFISYDHRLKHILKGSCDIKPNKNDRRFQEKIWHQNAIYKASMQVYLAWCRSLQNQVDNALLSPSEKDQLHRAVKQLTLQLAPNSDPGNSPVQHAYESRGASLVHDLHRMTNDLLAHAPGDRSRPKKNSLQVGKQIAATPGAVIHRTEMLEIIQYTPVATQVHTIPLLIIPSPLNRFYLCDLQEGNSLVHYLVKQGFQVYSLSWRNPLQTHKHWNLENYTEACIEAIQEVAKLSSTEKINVFGFAAGGLFTALACCILGQRNGDSPINSASFAITSLLTHTGSQVGAKPDKKIIEAAKALSRLHEVGDAKQLAYNFAWICPNNLLWNPLPCNYFGGESSPEDDIFNWNSDTLRTTAGLHCDFLSMLHDDLLLEPGRFKLCGVPIDLSSITCDAYTVAGSSDHITPWESCYQTSLALGGKTEFVLVNRGHSRTLVCPMGSSETRFYTDGEMTPNADDWLCDAIQHPGSWWSHWRKWLAKRSGAKQEPERHLGDGQHPKLAPAPGRYVFE